MAKNLYICAMSCEQCFIIMRRRNAESLSWYIQLLPLDYFKQSPDVKEIYQVKEAAPIYQYYNTNNPAGFWQIP